MCRFSRRRPILPYKGSFPEKKARRRPRRASNRNTRKIYQIAYNAGREASYNLFRKRFDRELQRAKLDAMKELAYGASHEINNPLANIALRAQTLLKREEDPDKRKALETMHRSAMRAHEMISDLMLFARPPAMKHEPILLGTIAETIVEEAKEEAQGRAIPIAFVIHEDSTVSVDAVQIEIALRAIIQNSLEAIDDGSEIAVAVGASDGWAYVEIRDNGPGIPKEILPHIFDPFFSGREAGRGLGFGLSKCWRIVTEHQGEVSIQSEPAQGVVALVQLPIHSIEMTSNPVDKDDSTLAMASS